MLPPNKTIKKIDEYLSKIDNFYKPLSENPTHPKFLTPIKVLDVGDEIESINTSIRSFIRSAFPDGETKLKEYENDYSPRVWIGDQDERKAWIEELKVMKNHLNVFKEDVEDNKKIYEIMYKKEITQLEAGRRGAVVEEKEAGATIELLTMMREELKSRKKQEKEISDLRKEIEELKNKKDKIETKENGDVLIKISEEEIKQMREHMAKDIAKTMGLKKKNKNDSWEPTI